ncbi:MAG: NADP-specific glutamate dehydrogenase, partial [Wenzhouxiangellaceae bacterium]|nr:NADP-specific glutamate dehydrogenase [Wenzhouxiangellaceae bacterium]
SVNESVLKFLGFEQIFKNALTGLPMGGAKGGSNFNPKGKSDREVMRFCQAFMTELSKHIGASVDVPAGDIGVGGREIGYLFGQHKRISNEWGGVLTGKGLEYGGSVIRTEATGYGVVYFLKEMLDHCGQEIEGRKAVVSGSGNVAQYCAEELINLGAKVLTLSDSGGFIHDPDGIDREKLEWVKELKNLKRGRIEEYAEKFPGAEFHADKRPWGVPADFALPCATQNELSEEDAKRLIDNGLKAVAEGANMPTELGGVHRFLEAGVLFGPAKAANAGGVATSGLEQTQNAMRVRWTREEVDQKLRGIMRSIHDQCVEFGTTNGYVDYVRGANIAGFQRVANAMLAYGVV